MKGTIDTLHYSLKQKSPYYDQKCFSFVLSFSCVGLAQKCIIPAFRMHLRAHGTVTKIFMCLQDAAGDPVSFFYQ